MVRVYLVWGSRRTRDLSSHEASDPCPHEASDPCPHEASDPSLSTRLKEANVRL